MTMEATMVRFDQTIHTHKINLNSKQKHKINDVLQQR